MFVRVCVCVRLFTDWACGTSRARDLPYTQFRIRAKCKFSRLNICIWLRDISKFLSREKKKTKKNERFEYDYRMRKPLQSACFAFGMCPIDMQMIPTKIWDIISVFFFLDFFCAHRCCGGWCQPSVAVQIQRTKQLRSTGVWQPIRPKRSLSDADSNPLC